MTHPDFRTVKNLASRALAAGGKHTGLATVEWDIAGQCQSPIPMSVRGTPETAWTKGVDPKKGLAPPVTVELSLPCRKCDKCLQSRRNLWTDRATIETFEAQRSWFGTLTLNPWAHDLIRDRCRVAMAGKDLDFDALSFKEQFIRRHGMIGPELTKWLKRVRRNSGVTLRYMLVAEQHKNFLPHYHLLLHEQMGSTPLLYRHLKHSWELGFSQFKLVLEDRRAVRYVCKYLAKSGAARVRASRFYGRRSDSQVGAAVREAISGNLDQIDRSIATANLAVQEAQESSDENLGTTPDLHQTYNSLVPDQGAVR